MHATTLRRRTFLTSCISLAFGGTSHAELDSMNVSPPPGAIQLAYQPFAELRYNQSVSTGPFAVNSNFSILGEKLSDKLVLTLKYGSGTIGGKPWSGAGYDTRLTIDNNGQVIDMVARNSGSNISSSDNRATLEAKNAFLQWILPIYVRRPVRVGEIAARTPSTRTPDGMMFYTLVLRGFVDFRGKRAIRLDVGRMFIEQKTDPNAADSYPEDGYFLINPNNGTVLRARGRGPAGSARTVDLI